MTTLQFNPILDTDSYKLCHAFAYPDYVTGMFSYIEARTGGRDIMVPFGLQVWLREYLSVQITVEMVNEAETFAAAHGEPFSRDGWLKVVNKYNGYLPLTIRAVPEGTPVRSGNALVTVKCVDPDLYWLTSYVETSLLRAVWYPTTIASLDYDTKLEIKRFYEIAGADLGFLPFATSAPAATPAVARLASAAPPTWSTSWARTPSTASGPQTSTTTTRWPGSRSAPRSTALLAPSG